MTRAIMRRPAPKEGGSQTAAIAKGVLLGLGGLVAIGLAFALLKYVIVLGLLGGAAYFGYRALSRSKAIAESTSRPSRSIAEGSDFDRKMRELEAIERQLDREISGR